MAFDLQTLYLVSAVISLVSGLGWLAPKVISMYQWSKSWAARRSQRATQKRIIQLNMQLEILSDLQNVNKSVFLVLDMMWILSMEGIFLTSSIIGYHANMTVFWPEKRDMLPLLCLVGASFCYMAIWAVSRLRNKQVIGRNISRINKMLQDLEKRIGSYQETKVINNSA